MKIKTGILLFAVFLLMVACKQDETSDKALKNEENVTRTDSISPEPAVTQEDTQRIWKVNIGLLPDIKHKGNGVKALLIKPGQEAEKAGLKAGDVVIELDGMPVKTMEEYTMYMGKFKKGEFVEMTIIRGNQTIKKKLTFD